MVGFQIFLARKWTTTDYSFSLSSSAILGLNKGNSLSAEDIVCGFEVAQVRTALRTGEILTWTKIDWMFLVSRVVNRFPYCEGADEEEWLILRVTAG